MNFPPAPLPMETHDRLVRDYWRWLIPAILERVEREKQQEESMTEQRNPDSDQAA